MSDHAATTLLCLVKIGSEKYTALAILADPRKGDRFTDDILDLVEKRARADELTVMSTWPIEHWHIPRHVRLFHRELVNSVAPAAWLPLAADDKAIIVEPLHVEGRLSSPILISSLGAMRYVSTSFSDPRRTGLVESERIRTDFSAFSHLWNPRQTDAAALDFPPDQYVFRLERRMRASNIGGVMGRFHNDRIYLSDAHLGNFSDNGKIFYDVDTQHDWSLLRTPSAAQCATTLVPLLMDFDSSDYQEFRDGYRSARGDAGEDVHNCIEFGDLTGWMRYLVVKDFPQVYQAAHLQLSRTEFSAELPPAQLLRALAIACSQLQMTSEANENFVAALEGSAPEDQSLIHFNFANHLLRAGDRERAVKHLNFAVDLAQGYGIGLQVLKAARQMLETLD